MYHENVFLKKKNAFNLKKKKKWKLNVIKNEIALLCS